MVQTRFGEFVFLYNKRLFYCRIMSVYVSKNKGLCAKYTEFFVDIFKKRGKIGHFWLYLISMVDLFNQKLYNYNIYIKLGILELFL